MKMKKDNCGTATIYADAFGEDWIVEFNYTITSPGCAAQTYGPPENCYPAEAMEYEVELIALRRDIPTVDYSTWVDQEFAAKCKAARDAERAPVEVPAWLKDQIETWLMESTAAYDAIIDDMDGEAA